MGLKEFAILNALHFSTIAIALAPDYGETRVLASMSVQAGEPPATVQQMASQPNIARLVKVFTSLNFSATFPHANQDAGPQSPPYNYLNFIKAAWKFPFFCGESGQTDADCLHELVIMLAHFAQETGGKRDPQHLDGLYHFREMGCYDSTLPHAGNCPQYCKEDGIWAAIPCGNRQYYGRGAKQLSWNYNYAAFSQALTKNSSTFLLEPDRIVTQGWPAFASAFWFYMTPQPPKPSIHEVATGLWTPNAEDVAAGLERGFGVTTNIINGAIECGKGAESEQSSFRITYYRALCQEFPMASCFASTSGDRCGAMQNFPDLGLAGVAPPRYLDRRWDGVETCQKVDYQTPWLVRGGERECMCYFWATKQDCKQSVTSGHAIVVKSNSSTRCGASWTAANKQCMKDCAVPADCADNENCFADLDLAPCRATRDQNVGNGGDPRLRCGSTWAIANEKCGKLCVSNAECSSTEACFADLNFAPCRGSIVATGSGLVAKYISAIRCGTSWNAANDQCGTACAVPADCSGNENCFLDLDPCGATPVSRLKSSSDSTTRCGATWDTANEKCGASCVSNAECSSQETCFADLDPAPCSQGGGGAMTTRCGVSWLIANGKCGARCARDAQCPGSEKCFANLDIDPCGKFFSKRCGTSRASAATQCASPCTTKLGCHKREECFSYLPIDPCIPMSASFEIATASHATTTWPMMLSIVPIASGVSALLRL